MEENKIMSAQIKGLLIALIVIVLGIVGYYTELGFNNWFNWAVNGIMFVAVIIACVHFAKQKDGYVTFGNVFMHGFKITSVIAAIVLIYSLLAFTVLFPDMKERMFEMQQAQMEKQGFDDDKMEQGMAFMKKYFMIFLVLGVIFGTLIWGSIASLIGAAVAKKKPVNPMTQGGM